MTTDYRALCAELLQAWDDLPWEYDFKGNPVGPLAEIDDTPFDRARAALAEQPIPVPPPYLQDETLLNEADACFLYGEDKYTGTPEEVIAFARRMIVAGQRWGYSAPQSIPVSERLPGPEDCDAEGLCWWWNNERQHWSRVYRTSLDPGDTWLPSHALPLPEVEG